MQGMFKSIAPPKKAEGFRLPLVLYVVQELTLCLHASEAVAAVDRTVRRRLKGHTSFAAAGSAGRGKVLSGATGRGLAGVAASLAALRLVLEASFCVELLLTGGENEFLTTFFANQSFVFVHFDVTSLF